MNKKGKESKRRVLERGANLCPLVSYNNLFPFFSFYPILFYIIIFFLYWIWADVIGYGPEASG